MRDDPELIHAVIHALNEWMHETWTFNYEDRIFADAGHHAADRREGDRGARVGASSAAPRSSSSARRRCPASAGSRSFGFAEFDPFWQAVVEAGILVVDARVRQRLLRATRTTGPARRRCCRSGPTPFRMMTHGKRPIEDTMAALVVPRRAHPVPRPARSPPSRTAATGSCPFLEHLEDAYTQDARTPSTRTRSRRSSATSASARSTRTTSTGSSRRIGADHVLFGSDFPHPEGLAEPCSYLDHLPPGLPDDDVAKIMGGNLGRLMRVPVAA